VGADDAGENGDDSADAASNIPILDRLRGMKDDPEEMVNIFTDVFRGKLATILDIPFENLDASQPTSKYGLDSLVAVELHNWFQRRLEADIPIFEILRAPSIKSLVEKVVDMVRSDGDAAAVKA